MTNFLIYLVYNELGENMKKVLIIILCCILLGSFFALKIYKDYRSEIKSNPTYSQQETIYFLQIGAYESSSNVERITKSLPNYYIETNGDLYYIYVAMVKDKNNIKKIKAFYKVFGNNIYVKEKTISNSEFINMLTTYENIVLSTEKKEVVYTIYKELFNKYKEVISG